jgi:molecular chaperone HscB
MTDFFEFFGLERHFFLDEDALKRAYYQNSKAFHPDFHSTASPEQQMEKLQLSSLNNKAYKALARLYPRVEHLLALEGMLDEEGKAKVPQDFLMEMMELNESLMELEMEPSPELRDSVQKAIDDWNDNLWAEIEPVMKAWDQGNKSTEELLPVKAYYLKKKYLDRLSERIKKDGASEDL